ncbi:hypothetical protein AMAG_20222 [Allomyces macrogynus ATCC 38327]|uniref:Uncharacterized protein n=1 Tax=Allomyces macrogynus (strain ATCC 38327) TaxID=578462 RepID=A0A0L0T5U6_ALLM3|nr:hypothetical protein AMAG_20222 [Allomyces macrogynus ATCC 38327]|eukprot:KNE70051.1 hypothetical protein AMAG_20222 [Allomyces macrogynus ATCC 38327]
MNTAHAPAPTSQLRHNCAPIEWIHKWVPTAHLMQVQHLNAFNHESFVSSHATLLPWAIMTNLIQLMVTDVGLSLADVVALACLPALEDLRAWKKDDTQDRRLENDTFSHVFNAAPRHAHAHARSRFAAGLLKRMGYCCQQHGLACAKALRDLDLVDAVFPRLCTVFASSTFFMLLAHRMFPVLTAARIGLGADCDVFRFNGHVMSWMLSVLTVPELASLDIPIVAEFQQYKMQQLKWSTIRRVLYEVTITNAGQWNTKIPQLTNFKCMALTKWTGTLVLDRLERLEAPTNLWTHIKCRLKMPGLFLVFMAWSEAVSWDIS